ncbi:hypothetical protein [Streptomyces omiyaensis]|uniref:hypothetical protein n=1 Tax=Streptomyces omiyaensis TaxID=68247 RepID=UPI0036FFA1B2
MITIILHLTTLALVAYAVLHNVVRPGDHATFYGLIALSNTIAVGAFLPESPVWAGASAGLAAAAAWLWWRHGGGDDTKRRLRRWARAFTPVRRTAPAA